MSAADLIRDTRRRKSISQRSLARRACTTQRHVGRIERGEVSPSVETVERLLRAMGERLALSAVAGPRANASDAELRAALEGYSVSERFAEVAELSEFLTGVQAD